MARVPKVVGVKLRGDSWHIRELMAHLRQFSKETDWQGRNGKIRRAAGQKSRSHRRSDQRLPKEQINPLVSSFRFPAGRSRKEYDDQVMHWNEGLFSGNPMGERGGCDGLEMRRRS